MAAAVKRAAERTDRRGIGGTPGHVFRLERVFADRAGDAAFLTPLLARLAGEIKFALRAPGNQRRGDEGDDQCEIGRERCGERPEGAEMRHQRNGRRKRHGADADGVDIVKMGTLEFDAGRGKAKRLVDEKIGRDGAEPRHGDDRKDAERFFQQPVNAEFH